MNIKDTFTKSYKRLRGYFNQPVPQGLTEFDNLINSLISVYNPPMSKRDVRFTVAAILMRLDPGRATISKNSLNNSLMRGATGQVGAYVLEQIKFEQKQELEAAQKAAIEAQQLAVASATPAIDEQPVQDKTI